MKGRMYLTKFEKPFKSPRKAGFLHYERRRKIMFTFFSEVQFNFASDRDITLIVEHDKVPLRLNITPQRNAEGDVKLLAFLNSE